VTRPSEEHRRVLFSKCGETSIEDYGRSGRLSTDHGSGKVEEVCRIINEDRRSHFGYHRRVRPFVWNVLAIYKGRSEHRANHRKVCDSVTDRRTDARTIYGRQEQGWVPIRPLSLFYAPWFLLAPANEIVVVRTSFLGSPWNSGTIADRPTHGSTASVQALLPAVQQR